VSHADSEGNNDKEDSALLKSARQKRLTRDYDGALLDVNQAVEKSANDEKAYLERARLNFAQKKFAEAISDCTKSIELKENPRALNVRAAAKIDIKDYEGAMQDSSRTLEISPGTNEAASALSYRGRSKQFQGNDKDAIDDFNASIKINANKAGPYVFKAWSEIKLKQIDQAKIDLDKAIELNPRYTRAYLERCYLRQLAENYKGALDDANAAVLSSPKMPLAYSYRGKLKASMGDIDGALLDIKKAIEFGGESEELTKLKNSIAKIVKAEAEHAKSHTRSASHVDDRVVVTPGQAAETDNYMNGVETQIKNLWKSDKGTTHKPTVLRFMIDKDGKLFDIQIRKSSGDIKYDESAKAAAARVGAVKSLLASFQSQCTSK
jgi:tetratricopeptide (TPR) repeat protein